MSNKMSEALASRTRFLKLRNHLSGLYEIRSILKGTKETEQNYQKDSLELMKELAPNGERVAFEVNGTSHAAMLVANKGADSWDVANLVDWIKQNPNLWRRVSTTVFDPQKFEAEIAAGNVKKSDVEGFIIPGKESASYIKFVNVTPESL